MTSDDIPGSFQTYDELMGPVRTLYSIVNITLHDISGSLQTYDDDLTEIIFGAEIPENNLCCKLDLANT